MQWKLVRSVSVSLADPRSVLFCPIREHLFKKHLSSTGNYYVGGLQHIKLQHSQRHSAGDDCEADMCKPQSPPRGPQNLRWPPHMHTPHGRIYGTAQCSTLQKTLLDLRSWVLTSLECLFQTRMTEVAGLHALHKVRLFQSFIYFGCGRWVLSAV